MEKGINKNIRRYNLITLLICFLLLLAGCGKGMDYSKMTFYDKIKNKYSVNMLIVGDSIGAGMQQTDWSMLVASHVKDEYSSNVNISNVSLGGNNTFAGYSQLNSISASDNRVYDLIILCYGENDLDDTNFPIRYEALIRTAIKKYPNAQIIAILESSQREYTNKINKIIDLCQYYDIPCVDAIAAFKESGYEYSRLSDDGIHPNELGKSVYADAIMQVLKNEVLNKRHIQKYPKFMKYDSCTSYSNYCYIPLEKMKKQGNTYSFYVPNNFEVIGIDRVMSRGSHSIQIMTTEKSYDKSYTWDNENSQRHIDEISREKFSSGKILLTLDDSALTVVKGVILASSNEFSIEGYTFDIDLFEISEYTLPSVSNYTDTIININGVLSTSVEADSIARNYCVYVYEVDEGSSIEISSKTIGLVETITRYAFYKNMDGTEIIKQGARNTGGWGDSYTADVYVPKGAKYLFVTSQNGSIPTVSKKNFSSVQEQINYIDTMTNHVLGNDGRVLGIEASESNANYTVFIYDVSEVRKVKISSKAIGNVNVITRFAFYADSNGKELISKGSLNEGGWEDTYDLEIKLPKEAKYLYVTSQNGTVPSVIIIE